MSTWGWKIGGIPTMRFTGSEIWADAMKCVDEVIEYFWNRYRTAISGEVQPGVEEEPF